MKRPGLAALSAACLLSGSAARGEEAVADVSLDLGAFGKVFLYVPSGAPEQVVLFVSGDGGWNRGVVSMAQQLRGLGALVVGIDMKRFREHLRSSPSPCVYPAGDLEEVSRAVQLERRLPAYTAPILVGYSSGASLVYATLAAAPPEAFRGGISLGFCPELKLGGKAPCAIRGLSRSRRERPGGSDLDPAPQMTAPWFVLQGDMDHVCPSEVARDFTARTGSARFVPISRVGHGFAVQRNWEAPLLEAYRSLAAASTEPPAPSVPEVADLPLVEVPAAGPERDLLGVLLSGDGGWAEIDKGIAASLARHGVPVVGWSCLRYFWTPRTPEETARDLERLLRHYGAAWKKGRVLLIGYSFGADVLPFLVNRLSADTRSRIALVSLVGLERSAAFRFHMAGWLGLGGESAYPTIPETERLPGIPVSCIFGVEEKDSACGALKGPSVAAIPVSGGHHFGGDYERLGAIILRSLEHRPGS